jgi:hypothetical protein
MVNVPPDSLPSDFGLIPSGLTTGKIRDNRVENIDGEW